MQLNFAVENQTRFWQDHELYDLLVTVQRFLQQKGYSLPLTSNKAVAHFMGMPEERQSQIVSGVKIFLSIVQNQTEAPVPAVFPTHPEKQLVEKALDFFGLEMRDDLWAQVAPDEVIEVYDANDIQIFRTLNFFNLSSYSLLDLLSYEWFHLWQRPSHILEKMMELSHRLRSPLMKGVEDAGIPRHILKEIFEDSLNEISSRKSILIDFNVVCPLYRMETNLRSGYVVSCKGKIIDHGNEVDNLLMI